MDILIPLITAIIELIIKLTGNKSFGNTYRKKWGILNNLPPRRTAGFVGRNEDKQKVHGSLRGEYSTISLEGPGGVGKSRLAIQVAYECYLASRWRLWPVGVAHFGVFIWASDESGTLTLNSLLDTIALTLETTNLLQLPLNEKTHQIKQQMGKKSCLLVVDNFETIVEKKEVQRFLNELPIQCKILITSREHEKFPDIVPIRVGGLSRVEGLGLIRSEARRLDLNALLAKSDNAFDELLEITSGYPLAIKWAIGQIKQAGQPLKGVIDDLRSGHADIFKRVFERSWDLLAKNKKDQKEPGLPDARQLLIVFPLFASPATLQALDEVSGLGKQTTYALGQLVNMSLVETSEDDIDNRRYHIHPLTRADILNRKEFVAGKKAAVQRMTTYYTKFLEPYRDWQKMDIDYSNLEPEVPNLYQAMNLTIENGEYMQAYTLLKRSTWYLFLLGSWDNLLDISQRILDATQKAGDELSRGRIQAWPISAVYRHRGQLELALEKTTEAITLLEKNKVFLAEEGQLIDAWRQHGRVLHEMKRYVEAGEWLTKAYNRYAELEKEKWGQLVLAINLAELEVAQDHLDEATQWCQVAETLRKLFATDQERQANIKIIKGQIHLARAKSPAEKEDTHQGHLSAAYAHFDQALQIMSKLKRLDGVADTSFWLGQVGLEFGNKKMARRNLSKAFEIYQQMGIHEKMVFVEKQLENL